MINAAFLCRLITVNKNNFANCYYSFQRDLYCTLNVDIQ